MKKPKAVGIEGNAIPIFSLAFQMNLKNTQKVNKSSDTNINIGAIIVIHLWYLLPPNDSNHMSFWKILFILRTIIFPQVVIQKHSRNVRLSRPTSSRLMPWRKLIYYESSYIFKSPNNINIRWWTSTAEKYCTLRGAHFRGHETTAVRTHSPWDFYVFFLIFHFAHYL